MFGVWKYDSKLGKFIQNNAHNQLDEPVQRGITPGQPCGGSISNPTHLTLAERVRQRRFDKPTAAQIKGFKDEDRIKSCSAEVVREAKEDLKTGKMRVSLEVLNARERRVLPFSHVTDEKGITHVMTQEKADQYNSKKVYSEQDLRNLENKTRKELEEKLAKTEIKIPGETLRIERPQEGSPAPGESVPTMRHFMDVAIQAVQHGTNKGRTVG